MSKPKDLSSDSKQAVINALNVANRKLPLTLWCLGNSLLEANMFQSNTRVIRLNPAWKFEMQSDCWLIPFEPPIVNIRMVVIVNVSMLLMLERKWLITHLAIPEKFQYNFRIIQQLSFPWYFRYMRLDPNTDIKIMILLQ